MSHNSTRTNRTNAAARPRTANAAYRPWAIFAISSAISMILALWIATAEARPASESFADLVETLSPSVVNISTSQEIRSPFGEDEDGKPVVPPGAPDFFRDWFGNPDTPRKTRAMGSGFVLDASGVIITNNHVIEGADEVVVILDDGTELEATVEGSDKRTDLAVLRVKHNKPLRAVKFADSDKTRVGDWVLAIGNPFGLGGSVTAGIVSARGRDIHAGPYDDFIQTDAAINRGNSGGPLFTLEGEVVGINASIISPQGGNVGIGFAIPSNLARRVVSDLMKFGSVKRGWLGVGIQPVDEEIAESLGLEEPKGALVSNVMEGDPAAKGGIMSGDVILEFDGKHIEDDRGLVRMVADTPAGKTVKVVVWRAGKRKTLNVAVGGMRADEVASATEDESPAAPAVGEPVEALGMNLAPLSAANRESLNIPKDAAGVVVSGIARGSAAGEKGIRRGDVVVKIGDADITSTADVVAAVKSAREAKRRSVLVRVRRGDGFIFVPLPLDG